MKKTHCRRLPRLLMALALMLSLLPAPALAIDQEMPEPGSREVTLTDEPALSGQTEIEQTADTTVPPSEIEFETETETDTENGTEPKDSTVSTSEMDTASQVEAETDSSVGTIAANAVPPEPSRYEKGFFSDYPQIDFDSKDQSYVEAVKAVTVNGQSYDMVSSSFSMGTGKYYARSEYIMVGITSADTPYTVVISASGYDDLTLRLTYDGSNFSGEVASAPEVLPDPPAEKRPAPGVTADTSDNWYIQFQIDDVDYVSSVTGLSVNGMPWDRQFFKMGLNGQQYYLDQENSRIVFPNVPCPLKSGDVITVISSDYEDLAVKIVIAGGVISIAPMDKETQPGDEYTLHIRLVGSFEAAVVAQEGYDALSGATTSVTQNKNSNVEVQAALIKAGEEPAEEDWKPLGESGVRVDATKTKVELSGESGMVGVYSTYDSSLILAGTPKTPGSYGVTVTVTDGQGRTATSNELLFKVYSGEEYLEEQLTLDNCSQTGDGKYMYDMEPWAIKNFDAGDHTVTVPAEVKAWYGSHESGTYGKLGYAVSFGSSTTQTLIVPAGCDLTLVNMDILSSVKIVVYGKLTLRDSVVQGVVDVGSGGVFSMNYDPYSGEFLMGASINGQLVLRDGATVENAVIYSNSNYYPNGDEARTNDQPVVVAEGNVTVKGDVYIRGDEAATGGNGQPGLRVSGTLTILENACLGVYGGGYSALTSHGGDAVILDGGTIAGGGKLVAVGGYGAGMYADCTGGDAIAGNGGISVGEAWLQGGHTFKGTAGKSMADGVVLSAHTNRNLIDGNTGWSYGGDDGYWYGSARKDLPDLDKDYPVEQNAPGSESGQGGGTTGGSGDPSGGIPDREDMGNDDPQVPVVPSVEELPDEQTPLAGGVSDGSGAEHLDGEPPVVLPDVEVPLTDLPDLAVPSNASPQTGDASQMYFWAVLAICAFLGLAILFRFGSAARRSKRS